MSLSFVAAGFGSDNFLGLQRLFAIGTLARYNPNTEEDLAVLSFDKEMRSLWLHPSDTATANVIVFSNDFGNSSLPAGDFAGDYLQLSFGKDVNQARVNLVDFQLADRVSSVLLVNTARAPELRVSFRDQFLDTWNNTLDQLMGSQASRKGDPVMTWAMFPQGIQFLDPNQIFLRITQALKINLHWWPDYNASLTYYLFLFPDASGQVQGFVQRWETWVEGGIKSSEISDHLASKTAAGAAIVNQKLQAAFANLPPVTDLYYLPGRQVTPVDIVQDGTTLDDITVVFQLRT